jgi:hypothetical protein
MRPYAHTHAPGDHVGRRPQPTPIYMPAVENINGQAITLHTSQGREDWPI